MTNNSYYERNKEFLKEKARVRYSLKKEEIKRYVSIYQKENKEKKKVWAKKYRDNNKHKRLEYLIKNKDRINKKQAEYLKKRDLYDLNFKLSRRIRSRLYKYIVGSASEVSAVRDLGCDIETLKIHLEKQFKDGMVWETYGSWHIDHIKPLSKYNLADEDEMKKACHYTNLQPLWAVENLIKRDSYATTQ